MAVEFKAAENVTRTGEYHIWPKDLVIKSELNGRFELPDISALIADIERRGQTTPVLIRKDGDKPVLVQGFSRWRAICDINDRNPKHPRKIRCVYQALTEKEGFLANVAENAFRNDTTAIDDAHNIKRMMNVYGMTEDEIATVYFPIATSGDMRKDALKWVRKRAKLITLTPEAEKAVIDGRIKPNAAAAIAALSEEQQRKAIAGDGKVNGAAIRKAAGKPAPVNIKATLKSVVETGKFPGAKGKLVDADDNLIAFLSGLLGIQAI